MTHPVGVVGHVPDLEPLGERVDVLLHVEHRRELVVHPRPQLARQPRQELGHRLRVRGQRLGRGAVPEGLVAAEPRKVVPAAQQLREKLFLFGSTEDQILRSNLAPLGPLCL